MTTNKIQARIKALLAQAEDQKGTPEGDAFERKAFELLGKYGLTEFDLGQDRNAAHEMTYETFHVTGPYHIQKQLLMSYIGEALGCIAARVTNSREVRIAGTRRNVERTIFLYQLLVVQAESEAVSLTGDYHYSTKQVRASFWVGFGARVNERLKESESVAREEAAKSGALVPVDEYSKATKHMMEMGDRPGKSNLRSRLAARGIDSGRESADRADLGQARVQGRLELT